MKRTVSALGKLDWGKRACAVSVLCAMTAIELPALGFQTLQSLDGPNGAYPFGALVQGINGDLYGTTQGGGMGSGSIFKMTAAGTVTNLYSFCAQSGCTDGEYPAAGLVQAANGDLYGTTPNGGVDNSSCQNGSCGTVFKLTPSGTLTTLHSFDGTDGNYPYAGLVQASNGYLYGTTLYGGAGSNGTVFKITPSGTLTTLYNFCSQTNCTDGAGPTAGLVQATNGDLYGTTYLGGANGYGTVFKMTPSGTLTTLYSFCSQANCADGEYPFAALVQATNGYLFGTTYLGGANGYGTVFKITPSGTLTALYSFCSQTNCTDGHQPAAALVQATNGDLYGTTELGGANGSYGTIFKVTPAGALQTLHSFCARAGCPDGQTPTGLVQITNAMLYGTTFYGGAHDTCITGSTNLGCGTVFRMDDDLSLFVETRPTSGEAGETVEILGTVLTGATSVSFNGIAATFTVVSESLITATVPVGASTGKVEVVTPSGTLSSNVAFRVP